MNLPLLARTAIRTSKIHPDGIEHCHDPPPAMNARAAGRLSLQYQSGLCVTVFRRRLCRIFNNRRGRRASARSCALRWRRAAARGQRLRLAGEFLYLLLLSSRSLLQDDETAIDTFGADTRNVLHPVAFLPSKRTSGKVILRFICLPNVLSFLICFATSAS